MAAASLLADSASLGVEFITHKFPLSLSPPFAKRAPFFGFFRDKFFNVAFSEEPPAGRCTYTWNRAVDGGIAQPALALWKAKLG